MKIDSAGSVPLPRAAAAAAPSSTPAAPLDRVEIGRPRQPYFPPPAARLVSVTRQGVLRPSADAIANPNGSHPQSPIDEQAPPLAQARALKQVLMARVVEAFQRTTAMSPNECGANLQYFAWMGARLDAISRALDSAHDGEGKAEVAAIQRELEGTVKAFEQIEAGAMQSAQTRAAYTAQIQSQTAQAIQQTTAEMAARRAATMAAYQGTRMGYTMPPPVAPVGAPVPGAPMAGVPMPGVPVPGVPVPAAPPGAPAPVPPPVVQTVYVPYFPGGMPYGWPHNRVHIDVPRMHHERGRRDC